MKKEIVISVNSPGEIAGWMKPAVKEIKRLLPDCKITVLLLKDVFASGREKNVLNQVPEIDEISSFYKFLSRKNENELYFLHIGGDLALTGILAKKNKTFAWGYQWGTKASDSSYMGYFVKSEMDKKVLLKRNIPNYKIHITGDLIYDAVMGDIESKQPAPYPEKIKTIAFMCGSRMLELTSLLPFYLKVAQMLKAKYPELDFKTVISPFIDLEKFMDLGELQPFKGIEGVKGTLDKERQILKSSEDENTFIRLVRGNHHEEMNSSDFIVSIPGTKTGEASCLEKPMIVVTPLNRPDHIPYFGIIGLLDLIPFVGKFIKGKILLTIADKFGFTAQPNILAEKEIVPEMMGILTPEQVYNKIFELLSDDKKLAEMRKNLSKIYSPFRDSAKRLAEKFVESVNWCSDSAKKPFLSVVICTHNRKELLKGTLESLNNQTLPHSAYEIIVVDDGSTDGTEDLVKSLSFDYKLRYIKNEWGGRSAARNTGINATEGEICVFVDDDILAKEDFLENHAKIHKQYPNSIVRGPIVLITEYKIPDYKVKPSDFSGALFCTCNASAPVGALKDLGGFDESFKEYGYEDNDMGWRLYSYGLKRRFNMNAVVYHYKPHKTNPTLEGDIKNSKEMARSAIMFKNKNRHWKTKLSSRANFFDITMFKLFGGNEKTAEANIEKWKKAFEEKNYNLMSSLESKIKNYYFMSELLNKLKNKNLEGE